MDNALIQDLLLTAEHTFGRRILWWPAGGEPPGRGGSGAIEVRLGAEGLGRVDWAEDGPPLPETAPLGLALLAEQIASRVAASRVRDLEAALAEAKAERDALQARVTAQASDFGRVNADLAARESLLRQILDTSSVAIFLVDLEGRITRANRRMERMFDVPEGGLEGAEYVTLVHPSEREEGRLKMRQLLASRIDSVDLERRYWRGNGQAFWGRLTGNRFFTSAGDHAGLVGVIEDIDDRKRTEQQLREREATFRQLFMNNDNVFLMVDPSNGRIVDANPAAAAFYGYDMASLCEMNIAQINALPPEVVARERARADSHARNRFVFPHRLRSGALRMVEVHSTPVEVGARRLLFSIVLDVTGREEGQAKLQQAASVFTASREGILITDAARNIIDVNPAFERITGYTREEVVGANPRLLSSGRQDEAFYAAMFASLEQTGSWQGELWNRRKDGSVYAERLQVDAVRGPDGDVIRYVGVFSDITADKAHQAELDRIAHFDELTGVPNRRMLGDRLERAVALSRRSGHSMAICYLDLDGFKAINDHLGHAGGDTLLVEVASRLKALLRDADTVARLGGDEFVLLIGELADPSSLVAVLERVLASVAGKVSIQGTTLGVSASIGVTVFPEDNSDPDTLLRHADQAMYRAKEGGKNRYHLFDPSYDREVIARRSARKRFVRGLREGELTLHYQPKIDLVTGDVIGAEALARWQHPGRGLLPPAEFLPLIEGSELEVELGEWVISSVLAQIEAWARMELRVPLSANVSAQHLLTQGFSERLRQLLDAHSGVEPGLLELEILETAALTDLDRAANVVAECLSMGVRFALDDFGTGYASLLYFQRLPIDVLKVDRGFVGSMLEDPSDLGIVESVVRLAGAFNRPVIAEGVESPELGEALVHLGCRYGQGFGIARPMPAEAFPDWMAAWTRDRPWKIQGWNGAAGDPALQVIERHLDRWVERLCAHLEDPEVRDLPDLHDMARRFTRWYHGHGMARYGHHPRYPDLGRDHGTLHQSARSLAEMARSGESDRSQALLAGLGSVRAAMQGHLDALREAPPPGSRPN
ncbi:MAG: EAL domain-containing protein [Rhodocyclaceae bacterium]|nr:EAL domain-containing protein [Rhodocyclaceae bacterium]